MGSRLAAQRIVRRELHIHRKTKGENMIPTGTKPRYVRIHGISVDHLVREWPTFRARETTCGEPADEAAAFIKPDPQRGKIVNEWTEERKLCRKCEKNKQRDEERT